MPTPDPGSLFAFGLPGTNTPVASAEVRNCLTALAQTNFTSDGTTPANPRKGMARINGANPNNWLLQIWNGSAWQTILQNIQLGIAAPAKSITNFATPANVWTINHNLGSQVLVMAFDSSWFAFEVVPGGAGGGPVVSTTADKIRHPSNTSGEGQNTGLTITNTPVGYTGVSVNGNAAAVGDGTKVGVDCYFSVDGGVTARAQNAIKAGDALYWNGVTAGFDLATVDRVDFFYATPTAGVMGPKQCTVQQPTPNRVLITFGPGVTQTGFVVIIG